MTIRLSEALKARAEVYATDLGISLNALVSVALDDYLKRQAGSEVLSLSASRLSVATLPLEVAGREEKIVSASKPITKQNQSFKPGKRRR